MSFNRLKYDLSVQNLDDKSAQKSGLYNYNTPIIKKLLSNKCKNY